MIDNSKERPRGRRPKPAGSAKRPRDAGGKRGRAPRGQTPGGQAGSEIPAKDGRARSASSSSTPRRHPARHEKAAAPGGRPPGRSSNPDAPSRSGEAAASDEARIAKVIARAGLCSRRDAEAWIAAGRVALNGRTLTSPAVNVSPNDAVTVDGQPLAARERTRLFLFHKPRGYVTTDRDPEGRPTIFSVLPDGLPRLVTIGRLDINTEGLLLLTNDGGLARVLELPATGWLRRYRVRARGETDQASLDALREGITVEETHYAGIEATLDRRQGANVWLTLGLREGKNREVKRVLETLGLEVNRLIRLSFGPFQLGSLAEGAVEEVKTRVIKDQIGHELARQANVDFEGQITAEVVTQEVRQRQREERRSRGPDRLRQKQGSDGPRSDRPPRRAAGTGGERSDRRPKEVRSPEPARPGRPKPGPRKHVSALRADRDGSTLRVERARVERAQTADRKGRAVEVERVTRGTSKASAGEAAGPRREARGFPLRRPHQAAASAERKERKPAPARKGGGGAAKKPPNGASGNSGGGERTLRRRTPDQPPPPGAPRSRGKH